MASPYEQRILDDSSVPLSENKKEVTSFPHEATTQSADGKIELHEEEKESEDKMGDQEASMELDDRHSVDPLTAETEVCTASPSIQGMEVGVNIAETEVEKLSHQNEDKEEKATEENIDNNRDVKEASLLSMVKGSDHDEKNVMAESEEAELLGLGVTGKQEIENIDEESERALLTCGDEDDKSNNRMNDGEENMDTSEKLQEPQHFGDKETNSRHDADSEVEMEMKRASTIHLPERVFNIDEETRMGLDQTPSEACLTSSLVTPLPPKKLFQLDDTKDSVDSETKMSANTDTEDIRLRNTISVDQENTKDSVASDTVTEGPTPSKRMKGYREGLGNVLGELKHVLTAENLFEYQWPQDGGEWHMLQEHISEFLKVKSFKRKYPDLYRRVCDKEEKDFLREKGVVSETQSDLGLTALRSEEVYDLMMKDHSERYQEYLTVLQEKQKRVMREKHKEYGVAKLDKSKMEAYSKKAARLAAEFNASLMREKREERQAYFDLQTYTIHHAKNKYRSLPPEETKVMSYPVALINGQYQDKVRMYNPDELSNLPIKTVLTDPPHKVKYVLRPPASLMKPVDVPVTESSDGEAKANDNDNSENQVEDKDKENVDLNDQETEVSSLVAEPPDQADSTFKFDKKGKLVSVKKLAKNNSKVSASPDRGKKLGGGGGKKKEDANEDDGTLDGDKTVTKIHGLEKCRICKQRSSKEERMKDRLIRCAQCLKIGHMSCLDLTDELVAVIKTYPWQCMECKACVQCMDPFDEDKMMFCDRCDRGYHTFCIGLDALPTGHWECRSCVGRKPDGEAENENNEDINSHNVIKEENQDSQDSFRDGAKGVAGERLSRETIDTKPLTNSDLTTDYLMKLAGRNTNWRKDTGKEEVPPPAVAQTPISTPSATPVVKKEKTIVKRKKSEANLNPTRSRPDRIQGARQSRRIKAREEEDEDKKNEEEEEDKKPEEKKMQENNGVKAMEVDDDDNSIDVKEEEVKEGIEDNDKVSDDVMEGVDDSEVMMNEEGQGKGNEEEEVGDGANSESLEKDDALLDKKEVKKESQEKEEENEKVVKEEETNEEEGGNKESEIDNKKVNENVLEGGEVKEEGMNKADQNESCAQDMAVEESASELLEAIDKLVEINDESKIDDTELLMEQSSAALPVMEGREEDGSCLQSAIAITTTPTTQDDTIDSTGHDLNDGRLVNISVDSESEKNDTTIECKEGNERGENEKEVVNTIADNASENSLSTTTSTSKVSESAEDSNPVSDPLSIVPSSSSSSSSSSAVLEISEHTALTVETNLLSNNKPDSSSSSLSSSSSSSVAVSSLFSSSSPTATTTTTTVIQNTEDKSISPSADIPAVSSSSSCSSIPALDIPISSIPLPIPTPATSTSSSSSPVSDIPLPPSTSSPSSALPPSTTTTAQAVESIDPSTIPLPMDTD